MSFIKQIDQYILGKLSAQEEEEFRQQLLIDSNLAQEVKKRELILSGLQVLGNQKTKNRINAVRKGMLDEAKSPKNNGRKRSMFLWLASAAAIFVFCFVGWQIFYSSEISAEELFAESYQPYLEDFGNRGASTSKEYVEAGTYYQQKNYTAAIPLLQNILKTNPQNNEVKLVLGDCLLSSDKIEEAIFHFNSVLERKTNLYHDPAQWLLALSYLKQNKIEECKKMLKSQIDNPQADYHQEAKELFSKLN